MRTPIHPILLLLAVTLIGACNTGPEQPAGKAETKVVPKHLKVGMRRAPDSINPYVALTRSADMINQLMYPYLWHETPALKDGCPQLEPYLVAEESWLTEPENTLRLTLAKNLTWSDGAPITTADVAFSLDARHNETLAWASLAEKDRIQSWKIVDEHTIEIRFGQTSLFNRVVLNEGAIIPKHHFSKVPFEQWDRHEWQTNPVVYGPYLPVSFGDERLKLKARDPKTPIQELDIALVRQKEALFNLLQSGDLDYAWSLPTERIAQVSDTLQPAFYTDLEIGWLAWNPLAPDAFKTAQPQTAEALAQLKKAQPHPVLGDARVRRALTLVMDREGYINRLWQGHATVPASPWRVGLDYLADVPLPDDALNLTKAAELLQEAGWTKEGAAWKKDGRELTFAITCNLGSDLRSNYLQSIQADLARFGIKVELNMIEGGLYIETGMSRAFDAVFFGVRQSSRPALASLLHGQAALKGNNWTSTTELDDLINQVMFAEDAAKLQALLVGMEQRFREEMPFTMLYSGQQVAAVRAGLSLQASPCHLSPLYRLETWHFGNGAY